MVANVLLFYYLVTHRNNNRVKESSVSVVSLTGMNM